MLTAKTIGPPRAGQAVVLATAAILVCLFSVSTVMSQDDYDRKPSPEGITRQSETGTREKGGDEAGTPPWKGPVFTLMAELTRRASDTAENTPPDRARYEINNYYQKNAQSSNPGGQSLSNQQVLRMDFPVTSKFTLRIDFPYVWNSGDTNGPGDMDAKLKYRVYSSPNLLFMLLCDFYFPSGSQPITAGKFQAGPGLELDAPVLSLNSVARFKIQQFFSYAGNSSYDAINYTQLEGSIFTPWSDKWWTELTLDLIVNWETGAGTARGNTGSKLEFEIGRKITNHVRAYIKPGAGLWGAGQPNVYDWSFRGGVYYLF